MLAVSQKVGLFCCFALCLSSVSPENILSLQETFNSLTKSEKSQWILDWMWNHHSFANGKVVFTYLIGTTTVCLTSWLAVLGVPHSTYYAIRKRFLDNGRVITKSSRKGRLGVEALTCLAWLREYANLYAEKLPDSEEFHLPPCLTRKSVYEMMREELQQQGMENIVSEQYFISVLWKNNCPNIKIPKNSRFSKCDTCTLLKQQIGETMSKEKRKKLFEQRRKHLEQQSMERQKYYKHALKSRREPDKYLSIIIDGMDQQKTFLPLFVLLSKFTTGMWKLKTHLVGTIVHGIGVFGFFDIFQWPHSTNLTLSILLKIFQMLKHGIPDVLYLQMDNCARENKNRYVFAFFSWLVERGIFKKVKISFLMVGHTHEDIDQVFSRFSTYLTRYAAMTLPKLMQAFERCYSPRPEAIETTDIFNITEWLGPYIEKMSGHSKPHCFKICKSETGQVKLFYKMWSTDKEWKDATYRNSLLKSTPTSKPKIMIPSFEKLDLDKLQEDVNRCIERKFLSKDEDVDWWKSFFMKARGETESESSDDVEWPIEDIIESKERRGAQLLPVSTDEIVNQEPLVQEGRPCKVVIGNGESRNQNTLSEGMMVLTDVPTFAGKWPQVGKVLMMKDNVTIHWFQGSKTTKWKPCFRPVKGERGKKEPWKSIISVDQIWKVFSLTPSDYLPKNIIDAINNYDH